MTEGGVSEPPALAADGGEPAAEPRSVLVLRDFDVHEGQSMLVSLARDLAPAHRLVLPGLSSDEPQGRIFDTFLRAEIAAAERIVALLDQPNANVGFELGYALGCDRPVALATLRDDVPAWLRQPPFQGYFVTPAPDIDALEQVVVGDEVTPAPSPTQPGEDVLFLCPRLLDGSAHHRWVERNRAHWRRPAAEGWSLDGLAALVDGAGHVVWIIERGPERDGGRDDPERVAHAVIAGFALARGIEPLVLRAQHARALADVEDRQYVFRRQDELVALLDKIGTPEGHPVEPAASALTAYRSYLRRAHANLIPFFSGAGQRSLDEVYVDLQIRPQTKGRELDERALARRMEKPRDGYRLRERLSEPELPPLWVVLGGAGSGKSTVSRHLCYMLAGESAADAPLPVFVSLARYARGHADPFELVEQDVAAADGDLAAKGLAQELRSLARGDGRVWILLDGLDEVPRDALERVRTNVAALSRSLGTSARLAVTSRPTGFRELPGFSEARLGGLDEKGREKLLESWLPGRGAEIAARVHAVPPLVELTTNPLLLTLVAKLALDHLDLPRTRVALYANAVDLLLRHGFASEPAPVRDPVGAPELLDALALELHKAQQETWTEAELHAVLRKLVADEDLKAVLTLGWQTIPAFLQDIAERSGLLAAHEGPGQPWRFFHRSLREFLSARRLARTEEWIELSASFSKMQDGGDAGRSRSWWAETFSLLVGQLASPKERLTVLQEIAAADAELALRCLPHAEGIVPRAAFELLRSIEGWDGDHLAELVREWRVQGVPDDETRALVMSEVRPGETEPLAYLYYGLEAGGVAVDRAAFFRACERALPSPADLPATVLVPPDGATTVRFLMGSPEGEGHDLERPQHPVILSAFRIGACPVTEAEYRRFEGDGDERPRRREKDDLPMTGVSWWQAWLYCKWAGGRLPTEAEWECACRAGTTTRYWSGDEEADLARVGWYGGNSGHELPRVGQKPANPWGLHDVHGNVWEWCVDWFDPYTEREQRDPAGPAGGDARVLRGGACWFDAVRCRSAYRYWYLPTNRFDYFGFRVAFPAAPELGTGAVGC